MINDAISPDESIWTASRSNRRENHSFGWNLLPFVTFREQLDEKRKAIVRKFASRSPLSITHAGKIEICVEKVMFSPRLSLSPRYSSATMIRPRTRDKEKCLSPRRRKNDKREQKWCSVGEESSARLVRDRSFLLVL